MTDSWIAVHFLDLYFAVLVALLQPFGEEGGPQNGARFGSIEILSGHGFLIPLNVSVPGPQMGPFHGHKPAQSGPPGLDLMDVFVIAQHAAMAAQRRPQVPFFDQHVTIQLLRFARLGDKMTIKYMRYVNGSSEYFEQGLQQNVFGSVGHPALEDGVRDLG